MPRTTIRLPVAIRPLLARLRNAANARGQRIWIAGGTLRDLLLGVPFKPELDCTLESPKALLAAWTLRRGESAFVLDAERDTFRIVLAGGSGIRQIDLTRLRAPTIAGDLGLRDFTVNALAVEITARGGATDPDLLDPTGGLRDLRRRVLRVCSTRSLADDPLRVLRGVRIAAARGLRIEQTTRRLMKRSRAGLRRVSRERIRDEIFLMLDGPRPAASAIEMARLEIFEAVGFPGVPPRPRFPALRRAEVLCHALRRRGLLRRAMSESLEYGITRCGVLKLASLQRDLGLERRAEPICAGLMLGARATRRCARIHAAAPPPAWYRDPSRISREAWLDFFSAADEFSLEAILLNAPSPAAAARLLGRYARVRLGFLKPPLLTGRIAMRDLGLPPGPKLGRTLAAAKRAQDLLSFRTAGGALRWVRRTGWTAATHPALQREETRPPGNGSAEGGAILRSAPRREGST